jgi:DNA-directed RNA polymerase II subunit RPB9
MIRFCSECNNLLYPKENKRERKLYFSCRNCDHQEEAHVNCVYQSARQSTSYHHSDGGPEHNAKTFSSALNDLASDPTLPRTTRICPKCGNRQAVYFQARERDRDTAMTLNYLCCNPSCHYVWTDTSGVSIPSMLTSKPTHK